MADRRSFLKKISILTAAGLSVPALSVFARNDDIKFDGWDLDKPFENDQELWKWVRMQFSASPSYIYMNNAGLSPSPLVVREAWARMMEMVNEAPSNNLWRILEAGRDNIKQRLGTFLNCSGDELCIVRNATEALSIIVNQLRLNKGDEVVLCKYDYPRMVSVWEQKQKDQQIKLNFVDLEFPENSPDKIVDKYVSLFNKNTKAVYLTHMINWTGQIIPAARIAAEAKKRGILVILDPTQTMGQMKVDLKDLQCDYAGMSIHKWMHGPIGTGLLYIKKDLIPSLTSYFSPNPKREDSMGKFDDHGTRNSTAEFAIAHALDFLDYMTLDKKIDRLNYLKKYWVDKIKSHPDIYIYTPESPALSGSLVTFNIKNKDPQMVGNKLSTESNIISACCIMHNVAGTRISPSIYNNEYELDLLAEKILQIANA